MGKILIVLSLLGLVLVANASKGPFPPYTKDTITKKVLDLPKDNLLIGNRTGKAQLYALASEGNMQKRIVKAIFDSTADSQDSTGDYGTGVYLPAGSIIMRSWFYITTQFVDAGSGTMAVTCEDTNNIYGATDITGNAAGSFFDASQDGSPDTFVANIAAECEITVTVGGTPITADGKFELFVEYVAHD